MNTPILVNFNIQYPSIEIMSKEQKAFYNYFKNEINAGRKVELDGNNGYAILLVRQYLETLNKDTDRHFIRKTNKAVEDVRRTYGHFDKYSITSLSYSESSVDELRLKWLHSKCTFEIDKIIDHLKFLQCCYPVIDLSDTIGDVYTFGGKFTDALEQYKLNPQLLNVRRTNKVLNLKTQLGIKISGVELFSMSKKLTKFGTTNLHNVVKWVEHTIADDDAERKKDFLGYINDKYINDKRIYNWPLFAMGDNSHASDLNQKFYKRYKIKALNYSSIPEFIDYCKEISRIAENRLREEMNLPKVGEGWLAETELFHRVKTYFKDYKVIQHASPDWLGQQHLDIYIPELKVAIEYHGPQHYRPIDHFGGVEGFEKNQRRDTKKRIMCQSNGVHLIEVKEGYTFDEIIEIIRLFRSKPM